MFKPRSVIAIQNLFETKASVIQKCHVLVLQKLHTKITSPHWDEVEVQFHHLMFIVLGGCERDSKDKKGGSCVLKRIIRD